VSITNVPPSPFLKSWGYNKMHAATNDNAIPTLILVAAHSAWVGFLIGSLDLTLPVYLA
jgi:hypothetical protein